MSNPKKRTKRNNELQRTKRLAAAQLTGCAMVYVSTAEVKMLYSEKHGMYAKVYPAINHALEKIRWPWNALLAVFCRESNGKLKMVTAQADNTAEYFYSELGEVLSEKHAALARECREKMEVFGVGWYAVPRHEDIDENHALAAFEQLECWQSNKHKPLTF